MQQCKWSDNQATYFVDTTGLPDGIGSADFIAAAGWAMRQWERYCGFRFYAAPDSPSARLTLRFAATLPPEADPSFTPAWLNGTELGLTQEPCGQSPDARLWSVYNPAAAWSVNRLRLTLVHEIGHFLGLNHVTGYSSIMSAILDESLSGPTPYDIACVQALYGPPLGTAPIAEPGPAASPARPRAYEPVELPLPDGSTLRLEISLVPPGQ